MSAQRLCRWEWSRCEMQHANGLICRGIVCAAPRRRSHRVKWMGRRWFVWQRGNRHRWHIMQTYDATAVRFSVFDRLYVSVCVCVCGIIIGFSGEDNVSIVGCNWLNIRDEMLHIDVVAYFPLQVSTIELCISRSMPDKRVCIYYTTTMTAVRCCFFYGTTFSTSKLMMCVVLCQSDGCPGQNEVIAPRS